MEKKGQFFILSAVILSALIISLSYSINKASVNREPANFYDYTYEVKKESGAVLNWEIYSGFDDDANLTHFVDLLADDAIDKYPDANFLFIYGNNDDLTLRNYGTTSADVNGEDVSGENEEISATVSCSGSSAVVPIGGYYSDTSAFLDLEDDESLEITVAGQTQTLDIGDYKQVYFIIQRNVDGDSYVSVS